MTDPFVSIDDLSDIVGTDLTTDDVATIVLDAACQTVRDYLGHIVNLTEETITLDGNGRPRMLLPQPPVREVSEVIIVAGADDGTDLTLEVTDYAVERKRLLHYTPDSSMYSWVIGPWPYLGWPLGLGNIQITYEHGWDVSEPDSAPPPGYERVPSSIRKVALDLAARSYDLSIAGSTAGAVTSRQLGRFRETFDAGSTTTLNIQGLLDDEMSRLAPYRQMVLG
jgi:hypothetical protein